jgi:hypothetical protein
MIHTHTIEIGRHWKGITFDAEIDCQPAEPDVGLFEPSFDVTAITVTQFGDHIRDNSETWQQLDDMVAGIIETNRDERDDLITSACEANAEEYYSRRM